MKPKLSVLLPAMLGYESVLGALDAWEAQTCRDQLEILVLCPKDLSPTAEQESALPPGQVIVRCPGSSVPHEARVLGIERASGDYVMFAEDHCVPDPDWAQAILGRLEEGWDGVGSALRPGNRDTCWAEGSFLIGYGEWMMPSTGGPMEVLCGWNGTLRTRLVRQMGSELDGELRVGAFLVRRLHQQGGRFYLEDRARMRHFDPPGGGRQFFLVWIIGMGFGAMRSRRWSVLARSLYALAAPAAALLHWKRAVVHYRRAGAACGLRPSALAAALVLASAWGLGEAMGALAGIVRVTPLLWRAEVKPVSREAAAAGHASSKRARAGTA